MLLLVCLDVETHKLVGPQKLLSLSAGKCGKSIISKCNQNVNYNPNNRNNNIKLLMASKNYDDPKAKSIRTLDHHHQKVMFFMFAFHFHRQ